VIRGEATGRFRGFAGVRGFYRRPWGRGWALIGDAGYFRDPITTHGITDALRDAELAARAIASSLGSESAESAALSDYERVRNEVTSDLFTVTERIAAYDWTLSEVRTHLRDVSRAMKAEMDVLLSLDAPAAA
jgi:flavin-dependent dehydrogenase